jgi:transposase
MRLVETKCLIDKCKGDMRKPENRISTVGVYAQSLPTDVYKFPNIAHVYLDLDKQSDDDKEIYSRIERLGEELEAMSKRRQLPRSCAEYYKVIQADTGQLSYSLDNSKVNEHASRCGYFVLVTNDEKLTSEEVLALYRWRDVIEKHFDHLKNGLDFKRLHTHTTATTRGKLFVGYIALMLRSYILRRLRTCVPNRRITFRKAIRELRKITVAKYDDSTRILVPLTKLQKIVVECLGLSVEDLRKSAEQW